MNILEEYTINCLHKNNGGYTRTALYIIKYYKISAVGLSVKSLCYLSSILIFLLDNFPCSREKDK